MQQKLHLLCTLTLTGILAFAETSELRAQTGLGLRLGQPEELSLTVDGRLTLESAAFLPVDRGQYRWQVGPGQYEPFRMTSGTTISQARIALVPRYKDWSGRFDVNFAGNKVSLADAYVSYSYSERGDITLGYFFDPISIGLNTATRHNSLPGAAPISFLAPFVRHMGIALTQWGGKYWLSAGISAGGIGGTLAEANHSDEGYGVAARFAYLPIYTEDQVLQLGVSASTRAPERTLDETGGLSLSAEGTSAVDRHGFIQTAIPNVQRYEFFGAEVAYRNTKFYTLGEFLMTNVGHAKGPIPAGTTLSRGLFASPETYTTYLGGYLTASYMLRGEQRAYNRGSATFRNTANEIEPGGNLELMARVSYLDAKEGGEMIEGLAALNWYPNKLILLGLDYSYRSMNNRATAGGRLVPLAPRSSSLGLHTLQLRAQLVF